MDTAEYRAYPFTAIVGQEQMKLALTLVAVQPLIGGVLIQGERGTAKTTAVRSLPGVLAHSASTCGRADRAARVIELPLNATEDRLVGTINVGALMKSGEREFVPGVLAEADGNILYVDEINLLEDHLVDLLLDAAATGVCHIEREGVSKSYSARFVLVGTMNPEEGTLRPQLLDRFGLSVKVGGSLRAEERLELVRRHMAFEEDPASFCDRFAADEEAYAKRVARAIELYPQVEFPDGIAMFSAGLCSEISVDGYRADLVMMRTARAVAAWEGRTVVSEDDVLQAARLVLPHRMKRLPFEDTGLDDKTLQKAMDALQERGVEPPADESEPAGEAAPQTASSAPAPDPEEPKKQS